MKTSTKRTLSLLLTLLMIMTAFPLTGIVSSAEAIAATGITLDTTSARIDLKKTLEIKATVTPDGSTDTEVTWATSNVNVADVNGGIVTAKARGTALITASVKSTSGSTYSEICNVEVYCSHPSGNWVVTKEATYDEVGSQYRVCSVCGDTTDTQEIPKKLHVTAIALTSAVVDIDESKNISIKFTPDNAANKGVTYKSSDEKVATVNANGVVTGIKAGKATITATSTDVKTVSGSCVVTVCDHSGYAAFTHTITKATCTADGEDYYLCPKCGEKVNYKKTDALGHDPYVSVPATAATCTTSGNTAEKKCTRCSATVEAKKVIAATGHDFSTTWAADGKGNHFATCKNPGCNEKNTVACTYGNGAVTAPTCTEKGYTTYTCTVCKGAVKKDEKAALGHVEEWKTTKEASYSNAGEMTLRCTRCKQTLKTEEIAQWKHVTAIKLDVSSVSVGKSEKVNVTFTPADAYNKGITWKSSNTKVATVDANGLVKVLAEPAANETVIITATSDDVDTVKATVEVKVCNHETTRHKETAATCSVKGFSYDECVSCGKKLNYVETPMLPHDLYDVLPGKAATCTEPGYTAKQACRKCSYTVEGGAVIPAAGHKWSEWTYAGSDKHTHVCSVCKVEEKEVCTYGATTTVVPTCTDKGYDSKTCSVCGNVSKSNEKEALGHNWSDWTKIEGSDSHQRMCLNDKSHTETAKCEYGEGVVTAPGCKTKGYTTYTCKECGGTRTDSETEAVGHDNGEWTTTKEATYDEAGERELRCTRCGELLKKEEVAKLIHVSGIALDIASAVIDTNNDDKAILLTATIAPQDASKKDIIWTSSDEKIATVDKTGLVTGIANGTVTITAKTVDGDFTATCTILVCKHDKYVSLEAKAATCTEDGNTVEEKCSICGTVLTESTVIPNLGGHIKGEKVVISATCTEKGSEIIRCTRCNEIMESTEFPTLGHVPEVIKAAEEATCTKDGYTAFEKCSKCGIVLSESVLVPATGHTDEDFDLICDNCGDHIIQSKTVTGLKISSIGSTSLVLSWDELQGVSGYRIFVYDSIAKAYKAYGSVQENTVKITGLNPGSYTYCKVRPFKIYDGNYEWGITSTFVRDYTAPAQVTGLKAAATTTSAIKLAWNKSANATGYRVYKYNPDTRRYEGYMNVKSNSCLISELDIGTVYYFTVKAYRTVGGVNYWGDISAYFRTATRPSNTSVAGVTSTSKGKMNVAWYAASNASGYMVQYSTTKNFSANVATVYTRNLKSVFSGLKSNTTYYVRVRPFTLAGNVKVWSAACSAVKYVKVK